jgi:ABC-type multidrug transport system permease subunit
MRDVRLAPVLALTRARLLEVVREPEALFWMFVFPVIMAVALGIAFPSRTTDTVIAAVVDGPGAAATVQALRAGGGVEVRVLAPGEIEIAVRRASVQIVVEPGPPPTYRYDPARSESRLARRIVDDVLQRAGGRRDAWTPREEPVASAGSRYIDWLLPGLLGMTIMQTGLWGVGFSIVQSRTRKLLKRLIATPMRRSDFLLAQVLARMVFLVIEAGVLLGFGSLVFGVPMRGSWLLMTITILIGALSFAGIGLLAASRAKTVEGLSGMLNLVILPMWIVSGVFFASSNFPDPLQPFIRALPLTALNDALRALMLEGASAASVLGELTLLGAWGAASFGLALRLFRWM